MIPSTIAADPDVKRARRLLSEALTQRASLAERLRRADALVAELEAKIAPLDARALADDDDATLALDLLVRQKDAAVVVAIETSQKLDGMKQAIEEGARTLVIERASIAFEQSIASLTAEQLLANHEGAALTATETL